MGITGHPRREVPKRHPGGSVISDATRARWQRESASSPEAAEATARLMDTLTDWAKSIRARPDFHREQRRYHFCPKVFQQLAQGVSAEELPRLWAASKAGPTALRRIAEDPASSHEMQQDALALLGSIALEQQALRAEQLRLRTMAAQQAAAVAQREDIQHQRREDSAPPVREARGLSRPVGTLAPPRHRQMAEPRRNTL